MSMWLKSLFAILASIMCGSKAFFVSDIGRIKPHGNLMTKMSVVDKPATAEDVEALNRKLDQLTDHVMHLTEEIKKIKSTSSAPKTTGTPSDLALKRAQMTSGLNEQMAKLQLGQATAGVAKKKPPQKVVEKSEPVSKPEPVAAVPEPSAPVTPSVPVQDGVFNVAIDFEGTTHEIQCTSEQTILEAALENDIELPSSCMSGTCFTCPGKLLKGTVDQEESALDDEQQAQGLCLTCVSYPESDVHLKIISEDEL